jgi:hypothetical protein
LAKLGNEAGSHSVRLEVCPASGCCGEDRWRRAGMTTTTDTAVDASSEQIGRHPFEKGDAA